jgi:ATP-dependent RNA helicase DDX5/DBP2
MPLVVLIGRWHTSTSLGAPRALVLVPTRELAQQVGSVCEAVLRPTELQPRVVRVATVFGGAQHRSEQLAELQSSPAVDVVVATPGRLLDLSTPAQSLVPSAAGCIDLHEVRYVVLDEADKLLLSAGLAEQVATIHARTGGARQTLLFSATIPEGLPAAAAGLVNRPMVVDMQHVDMQRAADDGGEGAGRDGAVGAGGPWRANAPRIIEADEEAEDEGDDEPLITATTSDATFVVPSTIKQVVSICAEHKKPRKLLRLIDSLVHAHSVGSAAEHSSSSPSSSAPSRDSRILIFANKIKSVAFVTTLLQRHGHEAEALSSRLSQPERDNLLARFRRGELCILVATDVAARGVHIEGLRQVVCWDFGTNLEQYVHRIGRTGRQGQPGTAHAFFTRALRPLAPAAIRLLEAHGQPVDQYLRDLAKEKMTDGEPRKQIKAPKPAAQAATTVGRTGTNRSTAAPVATAAAESESDDDDQCQGGVPRWLAAKLVSPITGGLACLQATASKGERKAIEKKSERRKKKRKRDV